MDKKEQILEVSKKLILQKGYSKVSIQDITANLGISKGSFYTYFKSKADMIHEMINHKILLGKEQERKNLVKVKTMEESLQLYLWSRFRSDVYHLEIELVILSLFKNLEMIEEDIVRRLLSLKKEHRKHWEKEFEKYQKDLSIPKEEVKEYAELIGKMLQSFTVSTLFATEDDRFLINDIHEVVERLEEERIAKKINFLIKNIMKMIQA